jgi:hypothetical protein
MRCDTLLNVYSILFFYYRKTYFLDRGIGKLQAGGFEKWNDQSEDVQPTPDPTLLIISTQQVYRVQEA